MFKAFYAFLIYLKYKQFPFSKTGLAVYRDGGSDLIKKYGKHSLQLPLQNVLYPRRKESLGVKIKQIIILKAFHVPETVY